MLITNTVSTDEARGSEQRCRHGCTIENEAPQNRKRGKRKMYSNGFCSLMQVEVLAGITGCTAQCNNYYYIEGKVKRAVKFMTSSEAAVSCIQLYQQEVFK